MSHHFFRCAGPTVRGLIQDTGDFQNQSYTDRLKGCYLFCRRFLSFPLIMSNSVPIALIDSLSKLLRVDFAVRVFEYLLGSVLMSSTNIFRCDALALRLSVLFGFEFCSVEFFMDCSRYSLSVIFRGV